MPLALVWVYPFTKCAILPANFELKGVFLLQRKLSLFGEVCYTMGSACGIRTHSYKSTFVVGCLLIQGIATKLYSLRGKCLQTFGKKNYKSSI
jgi:hypothetical protein